MTTNFAPDSLSLLAESAFRFHKSREAELRQRVNTLCAIVNGRSDCDDIYANLPVFEGELSGNEPSYSDLERIEVYLVEKLEAQP